MEPKGRDLFDLDISLRWLGRWHGLASSAEEVFWAAPSNYMLLFIFSKPTIEFWLHL
jgi:hypothetical protein